MKVLYKTQATATGGRDGSAVGHSPPRLNRKPAHRGSRLRQADADQKAKAMSRSRWSQISPLAEPHERFLALIQRQWNRGGSPNRPTKAPPEMRAISHSAGMKPPFWLCRCSTVGPPLAVGHFEGAAEPPLAVGWFTRGERGGCARPGARQPVRPCSAVASCAPRRGQRVGPFRIRDKKQARRIPRFRYAKNWLFGRSS